MQRRWKAEFLLWARPFRGFVRQLRGLWCAKIISAQKMLIRRGFSVPVYHPVYSPMCWIRLLRSLYLLLLALFADIPQILRSLARTRSALLAENLFLRK